MGGFLWQQGNKSQLYIASSEPVGRRSDQVLSGKLSGAGARTGEVGLFSALGNGLRPGVIHSGERKDRGGWRGWIGWDGVRCSVVGRGGCSRDESRRYHFSQETKTFGGISIWSRGAVFPSCPIIHHLFVLTSSWVPPQSAHPPIPAPFSSQPPTHMHAEHP